jgi:hypothetical protein
MATSANPHGFTSSYMPSNARSDGNGPAIAGFVLALIALFFGWIPYYGWAIWLNALIFSCVGLSKARKKGAGQKGLAIAGLVISLVALFIILLVLVLIVNYVSGDFFDYYF